MKARLNEAEIVRILQEQGRGKKVTDICRKHGIAQSTFHRWKAKYEKMSAVEAEKLNRLEQGHRALKRLVADLSLDKEILDDLLSSQRKDA